MQEKIKNWLQQLAKADHQKREWVARGFVTCNTMGLALIIGGLYSLNIPEAPFGIFLVEVFGLFSSLSIALRNWRQIAKPLREQLGLSPIPETLMASLVFTTFPAIIVGNLISLCATDFLSGGGYTGHCLSWHCYTVRDDCSC